MQRSNYVSARWQQTHSGMLPQSRTLEEGDHAGKRQNAEGFLLSRKRVGGRAHSRGERARNANQAPSPEITGKGSVSSHVFVLDKRKRPLMPCSPARAKRTHRNDGYGYPHWTLSLPSLKGRGIPRGGL